MKGFDKIGCAVLVFCAVFSVGGKTVAWYRFDEGTLGSRLSATVEIINSAAPGTLTGYCRQQNSSDGISEVDTGYMPTAAAGFPVGNGVFDPASRDKRPNGRAFTFTTSKWGVYDSGTSYYVSKGNGGCVIVPQTSALHLRSFTVELFFKMDPIVLKDGESNSTSEQILVCLPKVADYSAAGKYAFALFVNNKKRQLLAHIGNSSTYQSIYTSENLGFIDGKWHHAAVTFDGGTHRCALYLDYAKAIEHTKCNETYPYYDTSCALPLTIGAEPMSYGRRFTGAIDEVRISDTALTPEYFLRPAAYLSGIDAPATVCHVTFDTAATDEFGFPLWKELNAVPSSGAIPAEVKWDSAKGCEPELVSDSVPVRALYNARSNSGKTLANTVALHAPTNQPFYGASLFVDDRKDGAHAVLDGSFTAEFFVRVPERPVGVNNEAAYLLFFGKTWSGGPMSIALHKNGHLGFKLTDADTTQHNTWLDANNICDDAWHHVALAYDRPGKTAKAYLDGKNVYTWDDMVLDFSAGDPDNSRVLQIGAGYGTNADYGYSAGPWIDEFRLSNVALKRKELLSAVRTRVDGLRLTIK